MFYAERFNVLSENAECFFAYIKTLQEYMSVGMLKDIIFSYWNI